MTNNAERGTGLMELYADWFFRLGPGFSREIDEDGYAVFEDGTRGVVAAVYQTCFEEDKSPEQVIAEHSEPRSGASSFEWASDPAICARAFRVAAESGVRVQALAAKAGVLVEIHFHLPGEQDIDWALAVWRSLQEHPPAWIEACRNSEAFLFRLQHALETQVGIEDELERLYADGHLKHAIPVLLHAIESGNETVRETACTAIECIGAPAPVILSTLQRALADEAPLVRVRAAEALVTLGEPAADVLPVLIEVLERPDETPPPMGEERIQGVCQYLWIPDRAYAAGTLSELGEEAEPARAHLEKALNDVSGCVRAAAAEALVNLGAAPDEVVPFLFEALNDARMARREHAQIAETLIELGQPLELVLPTLIEIVRDSEWSARATALYALGELGPRAADAVPVVKEALTEPDESVRELAQETLEQIQPQ